jgi:hypothetical protein
LGAYVPGGQEHCPGRQGEQALAPAALVLPTGQGVHAASGSTRLLKVPPGHAWHVVPPPGGRNMPTRGHVSSRQPDAAHGTPHEDAPDHVPVAPAHVESRAVAAHVDEKAARDPSHDAVRAETHEKLAAPAESDSVQ